MRIAGAFIANHAEWRESLLFASGGYPEFLTVPAIPHDTSFMLVVIAEATHKELGHQHAIEVVMRAADGTERPITTVTFAFGQVQQYVEGAPIYAPALIQMQVHVEHVGPTEFVIRREHTELATVRLSFRLAPNA
jgi:hypothetical protein